MTVPTTVGLALSGSPANYDTSAGALGKSALVSIPMLNRGETPLGDSHPVVMLL